MVAAVDVGCTLQVHIHKCFCFCGCDKQTKQMGECKRWLMKINLKGKRRDQNAENEISDPKK